MSVENLPPELQTSFSEIPQLLIQAESVLRTASSQNSVTSESSLSVSEPDTGLEVETSDFGLRPHNLIDYEGNPTQTLLGLEQG